MSSVYSRLHEVMSELIDTYSSLEAMVEEKFAEDPESYDNAIVEALEASIENAIDDGDITTNHFAAILSHMTEALEQLDPSAFDQDEDNPLDMGSMQDDDIDDTDIDDIDDYDE